MFYLLALLSFLLIASTCIHAFPDRIPPTTSRLEDNTTTPYSTTRIATKILSLNNTDLSSSFHTLIYYNPRSLKNESALSPRQASTSRRPIDFCGSPTASFLTSYCRYSHGHYSPLQHYMVFCQEDDLPRQHHRSATSKSGSTPITSSSPAPDQWSHHDHVLPSMVTENGSCHQDEICVDGELGEGVAYCVNKSEFGLLNQLKEGEDDEGGGVNGGSIKGSGSNRGRRKKNGDKGGWITVGRKGGLGGRVARMVVSGQDGVLPMKVNGIDLKAGVWGKSGDVVEGGGDVVVRQEKKCENCFELKTGRMGDEIDFLGTEAKMMVEGTMAAAATGLVWLLVSG